MTSLPDRDVLTLVSLIEALDLDIPEGTPPSEARRFLHDRWDDVVERMNREVLRPVIVKLAVDYRKRLIAEHFAVLGVQPPIMAPVVREEILRTIDQEMKGRRG